MCENKYVEQICEKIKQSKKTFDGLIFLSETVGAWNTSYANTLLGTRVTGKSLFFFSFVGLSIYISVGRSQ